MAMCKVNQVAAIITGLLLSGIAQAEESTFHASLYASAGLAFQHSFVRGQDRVINGKPLLFLLADVEYKGFFLESTDRRRGFGFSRDTLGYRLWQGESDSLALIGSNVNASIAEAHERLFDKVSIPELAGIKTREADFMLGLRWQRVAGQHYFSIDGGKDIDYHFGYQARAFYSYRQTLRNWDLYYNLGVLFSTAKVVDYYFGVRPVEVNADRPLYQAGPGYQLQAGFAAVYPLTEHWLFESGVSVVGYSRTYRDSPLTRGATDKIAYVGGRYVF